MFGTEFPAWATRPPCWSPSSLALLKLLDEKVAAAAKIFPDDLVILVYEIAGEHASFGGGLAQRAHIATQN
jgi:hypothetical protein